MKDSTEKRKDTKEVPGRNTKNFIEAKDLSSTTPKMGTMDALSLAARFAFKSLSQKGRNEIAQMVAAAQSEETKTASEIMHSDTVSTESTAVISSDNSSKTSVKTLNFDNSSKTSVKTPNSDNSSAAAVRDANSSEEVEAKKQKLKPESLTVDDIKNGKVSLDYLHHLGKQYEEEVHDLFETVHPYHVELSPNGGYREKEEPKDPEDTRHHEENILKLERFLNEPSKNFKKKIRSIRYMVKRADDDITREFTQVQDENQSTQKDSRNGQDVTSNPDDRSSRQKVGIPDELELKELHALADLAAAHLKDEYKIPEAKMPGIRKQVMRLFEKRRFEGLAGEDEEKFIALRRYIERRRLQTMNGRATRIYNRMLRPSAYFQRELPLYIDKGELKQELAVSFGIEEERQKVLKEKQKRKPGAAEKNWRSMRGYRKYGEQIIRPRGKYGKEISELQEIIDLKTRYRKQTIEYHKAKAANKLVRERLERDRDMLVKQCTDEARKNELYTFFATHMLSNDKTGEVLDQRMDSLKLEFEREVRQMEKRLGKLMKKVTWNDVASIGSAPVTTLGTGLSLAAFV